MTINTIRTTFAGRSYEVVADSKNWDEPMYAYVQVYRLRKDGSRGRSLHTHRAEGYNIWSQVRDEVKALEGRA